MIILDFGIGSSISASGKLVQAGPRAEKYTSEGHRGLTACINPTLIELWEGVCIAWETDSFPKTALNPYKTVGASMYLFTFVKTVTNF